MTFPDNPGADAPPASETQKLSVIRRRIGQRMVASQATAPHTLMAIEVDYSAVAEARRSAKAAGVEISFLPFIVQAVASGVVSFPHVNASVEEDSLRVFSELNIGIAVDLDFEGLIVPVIRRADEKPLEALAEAIEDLSLRARARKLTPQQVRHGTFTITNAGGYGTLFTAAIINQPQVAILSTDGIAPKPVAIARGDGEFDVAVHPVGVLALTWDHRAFDGAYAAAFLKHLKNQLEDTDWTSRLPRR
jgi:pyruvate dehydrogenase E2 component (dihydrolipoamide acetyltransferase)